MLLIQAPVLRSMVPNIPQYSALIEQLDNIAIMWVGGQIVRTSQAEYYDLLSLGG